MENNNKLVDHQSHHFQYIQGSRSVLSMEVDLPMTNR